jgi:DNA-binding transcriptional LysR family regulator
MDVYQLRSFIVLAEHLHFGRAARALHLSQPALTKQIHRLEEEIGSPLFERTHGATRLSSVGRQWLPEVQNLLTRFDRTVSAGRKNADGTSGQLKVGFGFHTLKLVPGIVAKLRASAPAVQITLRDMSTAEQAAGLDAGQLDIGFMRLPIADATKYHVLPVIEDRLALVRSTESKWPAKLRVGDCRDESFISISRDRSPGFFNHVLNLCAAHGFHPRIVQEVYEFSTAIALVRAGMGVTMIPQSLWTSRIPGVELHPIEDRGAIWKVGGVWRRGDTNPVLENFLRLLRKTT